LRRLKGNEKLIIGIAESAPRALARENAHDLEVVAPDLDGLPYDVTRSS